MVVGLALPVHVVFAAHKLTVEATDIPSTTVNAGDSAVGIAIFGFGQTRDELVVRMLRFHQYGTIDSSHLTNIRLYIDDGDAVWEPAQDTTQVGNTVANFDGSDYAQITGVGMPAECASDGSVPGAPTTGGYLVWWESGNGNGTVDKWLHLVVDIDAGATPGSTLGVEIETLHDSNGDGADIIVKERDGSCGAITSAGTAPFQPGLPRIPVTPTDTGTLSDNFQLTKGLHQSGTSIASMGDGSTTGWGAFRTSLLNLGDAFALAQVLSRIEMSVPILGDAFGLDFDRASFPILGDAFGLNFPRASSVNLTQSAEITIQRNSQTLTPTSGGGGGGGAPKPKLDSAEHASLIDALKADLGDSIRIRKIEITERTGSRDIDIRIGGIDPSKKTVGDMHFQSGKLTVDIVEGRGTATKTLSRELTAHYDVTAEFTNVGEVINFLYTYLIFTPEVPRRLPGYEDDGPSFTGVNFKVAVIRPRSRFSFDAEFADDPELILLNFRDYIKRAADLSGFFLDDENEDVPLLLKVNARNITNDDLGNNFVEFSFLRDWYDHRISEGKSFIIFKIDDNGIVHGSAATCVADNDTVTCSAEFSDKARGFSVFGLSAVLAPDDLTPTPPVILATPTQESVRVVPTTPSTMTPTPVAVPITPTPVTPAASPAEEEVPTEEVPTSTPESKATAFLTPAALVLNLGHITPEATPVAPFAQHRVSAPNVVPAKPIAKTPGPIAAETPTIEDADQKTGIFALPVYMGIAVGFVFALVGGAVFIFRIKRGTVNTKPASSSSQTEPSIIWLPDRRRR